MISIFYIKTKKELNKQENIYLKEYKEQNTIKIRSVKNKEIILILSSINIPNYSTSYKSNSHLRALNKNQASFLSNNLLVFSTGS